MRRRCEATSEESRGEKRFGASAAAARGRERAREARLGAMVATEQEQVLTRAKLAAAKRAREEAELGGAESVSERVGEVFAGYQCNTLDVRLPRPIPPVP